MSLVRDKFVYLHDTKDWLVVTKDLKSVLQVICVITVSRCNFIIEGWNVGSFSVVTRFTVNTVPQLAS